MNTKTSLLCALALSALAATGVQAQSTRAAVQAETAAAAGNMPKGEMSMNDAGKGSQPMPSETTRAAVKADARAARAAGTISEGERSSAHKGKKHVAHHASGKTRAQVKAETLAAKRSGSMPRGEGPGAGPAQGAVKP